MFVKAHTDTEAGIQTIIRISIWSLRFTPARGNHWAKERDCSEADIQAWLKIFRDDEPGVTFIGAKRKPPIK